MSQPPHYAVLTHNTSQTQTLIQNLLQGTPTPEFEALTGKTGLLFSRSEIERYMDEEERHDVKILTQYTQQSLKSMSSGEQKKALLHHLLAQNPDFLVLVNPFDTLDVATQARVKEQWCTIAQHKTLVQFVSRLEDILPITTQFFTLEKNTLLSYPTPEALREANKQKATPFPGTLPPPLQPLAVDSTELVHFNKVSVSFNGRTVVDNICWKVCKGEFWQLIGPNGSGKTTLLSMITGDSHKGYGQNLTLFGQKKGSGESVWELKKKIGYFTPAMTDKFGGYHTVEYMIISGCYDSIGLYTHPSDYEKRVAIAWLQLLQLYEKRNLLFSELTPGEKRLVMTARAMIKHPPLLILDEPTAGLDDAGAALFVALVNKIARESSSTIIFVSHRKEIGLQPQFNYTLEPKETGSIGKATYATLGKSS